MAINLNDNIYINAGKPSEAKYLTTSNTKYTNTSAVNSAISLSLRYEGLTVLLADGKEYWYSGGIQDINLVLKTSSSNFSTQTQNFVFSAPSGSNGMPSFRLLSSTDIPSLNYLPLTGGTMGTNAKILQNSYNLYCDTSSNIVFSSGTNIGGIRNFFFGNNTGTNNTNNDTIIIGYEAGLGNTQNDTIFIGGSSGQNNVGTQVNGIGPNSSKNNTGNGVCSYGISSSENNTGNGVVSIGSFSAFGNSGNNVISLGSASGINNSYNNVSLFGMYSSASTSGQIVFNDGGAINHNTRFTFNTTQDNLIYVPNKSGTIAFLDDIVGGNYLPLTGGLMSGDINMNIYKISSTSGTYVNINSGILVNSSNITTIDWETAFLTDSSNNSSLNWDNRYLMDVFTGVSVDWGSRRLINTLGIIIADWSGDNLVLNADPINDLDVATKQYVDGIAGSAGFGVYLPLSGGTMGNDAIIESNGFSVWIGQAILRDGSGVTTLDWDSCMLMNKNGLNVLNWSDQLFIDINGMLSLDWENRILSDTTSASSLNWENRTLIDVTNITSLDWNNKVLNDSYSGLSIDWQNKQLFDGGNTSINWSDRNLYDSTTQLALSWTTRSAYDSNGSAVLNWDYKMLNDVIGLTSIDWQNRTLNGYSGSLTLDWGLQTLNNYLNATVADWSGDRLLLNDDPINLLDAATKQYVDNSINGISGFLPLSGGTMTGDISSTNNIINVVNGTLTYSSNISLNWESKLLYDNSSVYSLDWNGRLLLDDLGNNSIDWRYRNIYNSLGYTTLNYEIGTLYSPDDTNGSVDWKNRILQDTTAIGVVDWSNGHLVALYTPSATNDLITKGYADANYGGSSAPVSITITTTTTISATTYSCYFSNSSTPLTLTLLDATTCLDYEITIKNINTGVLTIDTFSTQTIDGLTPRTITSQYGFMKLKSNGSNWFIIG